MTFIENLQKCSGTVKQDLNWQTSHKWNNKTLHNYNKKFFVLPRYDVIENRKFIKSLQAVHTYIKSTW